MLITNEQTANEVLKGVVPGNKIRLTFKSVIDDKARDFQKTFLQLRHKLQFDTMWLAVAHNRLAGYGDWGNVPRTQDFTVTRLSPCDREIFANILADLVDSIEIV